MNMKRKGSSGDEKAEAPERLSSEFSEIEEAGSSDSSRRVSFEAECGDVEESGYGRCERSHVMHIEGVQDHFSLNQPSNLVRFRSKFVAARVLEGEMSQTVLEESYDPNTGKRTIIMKRFYNSTKGLHLLRAAYTVVCGLWIGVFFVFCLQVLSTLILDLAVESGATSIASEINGDRLLGVVITIIVLIYSFASILVVATQFIIDSWNGHMLAKQFVNDVAIDWVFVTFFAIVPFVIMCVTLLMRLDNWWSITALSWFGSVLLFFLIFGFCITYYEIKTALRFTKKREMYQKGDWWKTIQKCIELTQTHRYSGQRVDTFLARTTLDCGEYDASDVIESSRVMESGFYSKITTWKALSWLGMYRRLETPIPLTTIDDVRQYRPYVTRQTWSLEKIFCRSGGTQFFAIVGGPGSVTRAQLISSLTCSVIGSLLIIMVPVSFFVWMHSTWYVTLVVAIIFTCVAYYLSRSSRRLFRATSDIIARKGKEPDVSGHHEENQQQEHDQEEGNGPPTRRLSRRMSLRKSWKAVRDNAFPFRKHLANADPSEGIFLVTKYRRISEATCTFCWFMFVVEIAIFFVFPMATLFVVGHLSVDILFAVVAGGSMIRHYISIDAILKEAGTMDFVDGKTDRNRWANRSRINDIIGKITRDSSRNSWAALLTLFGVGILATFLSAVGESTISQYTTEYGFLPDFYYPPPNGTMKYPSCSLSSVQNGFGGNATMADYAFLSALAYKTNELAEVEAREWYGSSDAVLDADTVLQFRDEFGYNNSAASFKLFRFPQQKLAIVSIRGTQSNWDLLADIQLYSAASLMQATRFFLPMGEIWTPILDELVYLVNSVQSRSLGRISFYSVTTDFANELKKDREIESLYVTGHSLGGGLSLITGAQAKIPAVSISGPNALISGRSFKPPISPSDLNQYTFNVIPERDIVPMIDDPADMVQRIQCRAAPHEFVTCHDVLRSLCEIIHTCGTGDRPAICQCHTLYGYPMPLTDGNRTFEEACGS